MKRSKDLRLSQLPCTTVTLSVTSLAYDHMDYDLLDPPPPPAGGSERRNPVAIYQCSAPDYVNWH
eukprot:scaffold3051_cov167-Ochromonas_danica.AAC.2